MAVLVDELREYPHTRLPFRHWCHLVSDADFEELHAFAASLGIPRHRFQGDHYDLPPHLRARAVELGAEKSRPATSPAAWSGTGEIASGAAARRGVPPEERTRANRTIVETSCGSLRHG